MGVAYIIPPVGTPASAFKAAEFVDPAKPPAILARSIDPATGALLSLFEGMDPTDAALALELRIERGSGCAVQDRGHKLRAIRKNSETAAAEIRQEIDRLLAPFVEAGDVEIVDVTIEAGESSGDMSANVVDYRNLRTRKPQKVPL